MKKFLFALILLALAGSAEAQVRCYGSGCNYFVLNLSGGQTLPQGQLYLPDGTAALPSLTFSTQSTTGIYYLANAVGFTTAGVRRGYVSVNGWYFERDLITWGVASDVAFARDAADTFAQKRGNSDQFQRLYGANGGYWERGVNSELVTIAAAATTDTTGNLLPADAIIESVVIRVTTVIPTAATFTVGDATTAARFATGVAVAANTTAVGLLHRHPDVAAAAGPVQTTAAKVRITPNTSPGAATGVVRVEVFFSRFVAPTS